MRNLAATLLLLLAPIQALAGTPVTLKVDTVNADGVITLGDLFDGAGPAAQVPVGTRSGGTAVLDAGAVQVLAHRAGLDWSNPQGLRRIVVTAGSAAAIPSTRGNVEILTYARSLAVGELVSPQDLVWAKAAAAPADAPSDPDLVIGLAAKRPLRAGAAVSARDVSAPQVIKAGDLVTVTYEDGGISLSLQAKAMAAAAQGETVMVQNTSSKKMLQAIAAGPGQALIGPDADRARAHSRYALR